MPSLRYFDGVQHLPVWQSLPGYPDDDHQSLRTPRGQSHVPEMMGVLGHTLKSLNPTHGNVLTGVLNTGLVRTQDDPARLVDEYIRRLDC